MYLQLCVYIVHNRSLPIDIPDFFCFLYFMTKILNFTSILLVGNANPPLASSETLSAQTKFMTGVHFLLSKNLHPSSSCLRIKCCRKLNFWHEVFFSIHIVLPFFMSLKVCILGKKVIYSRKCVRCHRCRVGSIYSTTRLYS